MFERKTNLWKKINEDWVKEYIKEKDKIKIDSFELVFNDSLSFFKPVESELKEYFGWATDKNKVYQNFKAGIRYTIKEIWGEEVHVRDTLYKRKWKITDSKRTICGFTCRKAVWNVNDSTRIYAWYCSEIIPSVGPESFYGLPGAIFGLASEDGGVIYFAKSFEAVKPDAATMIPPKTKKRIYANAELKTELEKQYGKEKWGKAMLKNVFGYW
ncbi:MAG: GLPGLI family protein [Bacteroidia bacterium]|nr:GLPGLI family protein [Bacteroidia bacterium]